MFSGLQKIPLHNAQLPPLSEAYTSTEGRIDFTNWYTYTIDGSDAQDLDDALSLGVYDTGDFLLGVHIADVGHFVEAHSPLDRDAYSRGTSIYLPEMTIPMLPEILSHDLCSLHPGSPKRTLSCLMRVNHRTGEVERTLVTLGLIESRYRGVYDDLDRDTHMSHEPLQFTLKASWELFDILAKRRKHEGKITFLRDEMRAIRDHMGKVIDLEKRKRQESHMLIEEFMVLANEEVAKWCHERNIPFLSRLHPAPPAERQSLLRSIMGIAKHIPVSPKQIRQYFDQQEESTALLRATQLILPKMTKAFYSPYPDEHFGLALQEYTHFTSPIRRYPDLITHRMIRSYL